MKRYKRSWPLGRLRLLKKLLIQDPWDWYRYRFTQSGRECWMPKGLPIGYRDCDGIMLDSCFGLLRRFVEDEYGADEFRAHVEWARGQRAGLAERGFSFTGEERYWESHVADYEALLGLYDWWMARGLRWEQIHSDTLEMYDANPVKIERDGDAALISGGDPDAKEELWAREEALLREEDEKIVELVKLRGRMWT
jgi:hypothetical protein